MRISDWSSDVCSSDLHTKSGGCLDVERHHMIGAMPAERLKELMAEHLATVHRTPYVIEFVHFHHDMFKVELPITKCGEAVVARIAAVEMALNIGCGNLFPQGHAQRQIGRASCRESVRNYVYMSVGGVSYKKKKIIIYHSKTYKKK